MKGVNARPMPELSTPAESTEYANLSESLRVTGPECLGLVNLPVCISHICLFKYQCFAKGKETASRYDYFGT